MRLLKKVIQKIFLILPFWILLPVKVFGVETSSEASQFTNDTLSIILTIAGDLMLSQFQPYVTLSDIVNLPRYHFLMKISAVRPEEPMSGETIPIAYKKDDKKLEEIIENSRKNYARDYKPSIKTIFKSKKVKANTIDMTLTK